MLGIIIFIIMLLAEVGITAYCLVTKSYQKRTRGIVICSVFTLMLGLLLFGVLNWGFRWFMLTLILFCKTVLAVMYFIRQNKQKIKTYHPKYVILAGIRNCFLIGFAILPAIMFPQFKPLAITGNYPVETVSYTMEDTNRMETFSDQAEHRKVTIQFWYPKAENEVFPLAVFSHGSFGFRGSNASTFEELASNGYVVCSIDHTYHAFFTKQTDGKMTIANMDFINDAIAVTNGDYDEQKAYELTRQWLELRSQDMNFILDSVLEQVKTPSSDEVYHLIDPDKIGLFGHSLGGATAAELGRERKDIDAVIVVDGTMLGEEVAFQDGKTVLNDETYPVPLLNLYNEEHFAEAGQIGMDYANTFASANAVDARDIVIKGAGHLNFTDLPLFSPTLAGMLGTGEVDSRYCIDTMNHIILVYFNHYLKGVEAIDLTSQY
ncbi:MAG: isoform [Firmicutes bacterium]|nr:isoform [Bacillota bacterium]